MPGNGNGASKALEMILLGLFKEQRREGRIGMKCK